jgi:GNAT superfamily N-acetyltransferase
MNTDGIEISALKDAAEAALAGQWVYQEWARLEAPAVWEENQADIAHSLDPAVTVPKFFACRIHGELAGIASVVPHDLPTCPELGPWLANVLVLPQWRQRGIGRALVRHVMDYTCALVPSIYLYTFDQVDLYRHLGWEIVRQDQYTGRPITIMRYPAAPSA